MISRTPSTVYCDAAGCDVTVRAHDWEIGNIREQAAESGWTWIVERPHSPRDYCPVHSPEPPPPFPPCPGLQFAGQLMDSSCEQCGHMLIVHTRPGCVCSVCKAVQEIHNQQI